MNVINFLKKHMQNITFYLFILFFMLGLKYIVFMYLSMFFIMLYFMGNDGYKGMIFVFLLMGTGAVMGFLLDYLEDTSKYIFLIIMSILAIYILWRRHKTGKSIWY